MRLPRPSSPTEAFFELRIASLHMLLVGVPSEKAERVQALHTAWRSKALKIDSKACLAEPSGIPGRPLRPELVPPLSVKRRAMHTMAGRAAMVHALAHIEFNAINLALDAIWRFPGMPVAYYEDWLQVAAEEALHFSLLSTHLTSLGYAYGDFDAHNTLWEMAEKTKADVLARIALVPRTMEARGLDATPAVRAKLAQAGDMRAAEILDIILRDEIGHVAIGNRWYGWLCEQRGLEPVATYAGLVSRYRAPQMRGPFNMDARRQAGFSEAELLALDAA